MDGIQSYPAVVIGAFLFLLVIMFLRSFMNAANRASFIDQRLDDYPRLYDNYRRENEGYAYIQGLSRHVRSCSKSKRAFL